MEKIIWDIKFHWKHIFLHFWTFLNDLMPFLLSHHPNCDTYRENHYITVKGIKLCIGCFFTYPPALLLILVQVLFFPYWYFLPIKIILSLLIGIIFLQILAFLDVGQERIKWKIFTKISLGGGFVLVFMLIFRSPFSTLSKFALSYLFYLLTGSIIGFIRAYQMDSTCSECNSYSSFPMCPGFQNILESLQKNEFIELSQRRVEHSS